MSTISVSIPTDADGYVSQECPGCRRRFKVRFEQGTGKTLSHCPYCRHDGEQCWWTTEQVEYLQAVASKQVVEPMLNDFARDMKRLNKPGSFIKFDAKVSHRPTPRAPAESETPMPVAEFECCQESIKHDGRSPELRCVICGKTKSVA